jgi:hypothetical protein
VLGVKGVNQSQQERLAYIDFRLYFLGLVSRSDLIERFGLKEAAATRDLALYKEKAPKNLIYDTKAKIYKVNKPFKPLFEYPADKVLSTLSKGFGGEIISVNQGLINTETPSQLNKPDVGILSEITRAIHLNKAVKMTYCSMSSGEKIREMVPFCLVDNGLRWHVRAYDRLNNRFSDFVLTRIKKSKMLDKSIVDDVECKEADIQWNRIVELEIIPHPDLGAKQKDAIEMDYGMIDGVLKINLRAAVAGYLLRRWNVDCSEKGTLKGACILLMASQQCSALRGRQCGDFAWI